MKKQLFKLMMIVMLGFMGHTAWSSNVTITQTPTLEDGGEEGLRIVKFGVSWDYSWRSVGLKNWDAVWVFVKYRVSIMPWDHMYLDATYTPTVSDNGVAMAHKYGMTDGKAVGCFFYREASGNGSINWENLTLRWKYNVENGYHVGGQVNTATVSDLDEVSIKVFAVEMVYVPQDPFYIGSGGSMSGEFRKSEVNLPYYVTSEDPIHIRDQGIIGGLTMVGTPRYTQNDGSYLYSVGSQGDSAIPAEFPKGFKAFYCMKYEISQEAYVDFLNTLTVQQQTSRTRIPPNSAANSRAMMQTNSSDRNFIKIKKPGVVEYGCDMNDNNVYGEANDGQNVACAMNYRDLQAYLDFSGLRPMTELEFEKACRGPVYPTGNEFAWGHPYFLTATAFVDSLKGTGRERPITEGANNMGTGQTLLTRNGAFANDSSIRSVSGATFYGVMEMSGNLSEYCVNMANATGRTYKGNHGDGRLTGSGDTDESFWPDFFGMGLRGGSVATAFAVGSTHAVSNRSLAWWNSNPGDSWEVGGRGVRTE